MGISSSQCFDLSYHGCRKFLRSSFSIKSWSSLRRDDFPYPIHDQLPPEMWGEMLSFLSNDISTLQESILVPDLRSGFLSPFQISFLSFRETPLLSMIPLIEGLFRVDSWTVERLYHLRFHGQFKSESIQKVARSKEKIDFNLSRVDEDRFDLSSIPPLKRRKTS